MRHPARCFAALLWILAASGCLRKVADTGATTSRDHERSAAQPASAAPPPVEPAAQPPPVDKREITNAAEGLRAESVDRNDKAMADKPTRSGRQPPKPNAGVALSDEAVSRAGARRLEAVWPRELSVSYQPDPALTWPELQRALAGRPVQGTVRPFARLGARPEEVENSGEILALAVARQLRQVGWEVLLEHFRMAACTEDVPARGESGKRGRPLRARVSGHGSFTVTPGEAAVARIEARVTFAFEKGGSGAAEVRVERRVTADRSRVRSQRARLAKEAALAAFVEELFRKSSLQPALVAAVRKLR